MGHFARRCPQRRCWFCGKPGHLKRNCPYRITPTESRKIRSKEPRHGNKRKGRPCNDSSEGLLLPTPMAGWARSLQRERRRAKIFSLLTQERELSCKVVVGGSMVKAIIDTGASVSLLREGEYRRLKNQGRMRRPDIEITQADGGSMRIKGMVNLPLKVGATQSFHRLYITPKLCAGMILGEDWLHGHRAGIEFNPTVLVVNGVKMPLGDPPDRHVTVVAEEDIKLPPRAAVSGRGRLITREKVRSGIL